MTPMPPPDHAWRLKWVQSKDKCEAEAWLVGDKAAYKIGSIADRITDLSPEIKKEFMELMGKAAAVAMRDLLDEPDSMVAVDMSGGAPDQ